MRTILSGAGARLVGLAVAVDASNEATMTRVDVKNFMFSREDKSREGE